MLYLYGVIERRELPRRPGMMEAPLTMVGCRDLATVVSEHETLDLAPTEEKIWQHEGVLEALMQDGPVLPVRFGIAFADEESLRRQLELRYDSFAAALIRLRGKVEVGVRVLYRARARPALQANNSATSGRDYLLERLARQKDAARHAQRIRQKLSSVAVDERLRFVPRPDTLLTASYLIDARQFDAFKAHAQALQEDAADATVICTGPWPPYNFAERIAQ